jgi:hypothetical protein
MDDELVDDGHWEVQASFNRKIPDFKTTLSAVDFVPIPLDHLEVCIYVYIDVFTYVCMCVCIYIHQLKVWPLNLN